MFSYYPVAVRARRFRFAFLPSLFVAAVVSVSATAAQAQHPLCPAPAPDETYFSYCGTQPQALVESFLYDFTVSQLFKGNDPLELPTSKIIEAMGLGPLLFSNDDANQKTVAARPSIVFRPLDRHDEEMSGKGYSSSGEFLSKSSAGPQVLESLDPVSGASVKVELPETVQGIYWRSPSHLELQFYAGHGIRFTLAAAGAVQFADAVQCISISRSEIRATTGDRDHRALLSQLGGCK